MLRIPQITADGSPTISIPELQVTYHSTHGAIQESMHVFLRAGLDQMLHTERPVQILEMGLGTGLNALLTWIQAQKTSCAIDYTSLEKFPLLKEEYAQLDYCSLLNEEACSEKFTVIHACEWETTHQFSPFFSFTKHQAALENFASEKAFDLVYYDAFAPTAQPELWTVSIFKKLFDLLRNNGLLVTYCCKGDVRRAMQAAGFTVEKIPGPPGKREMVRAWKK